MAEEPIRITAKELLLMWKNQKYESVLSDLEELFSDEDKIYEWYLNALLLEWLKLEGKL